MQKLFLDNESGFKSDNKFCIPIFLRISIDPPGHFVPTTGIREIN